MTRPSTTVASRSKSRWLIVSMILLAVYIVGAIGREDWAGPTASADRHEFRSANKRVVSEQTPPILKSVPQPVVQQVKFEEPVLEAETAPEIKENPHHLTLKRVLGLLETGYQRLQQVSHYTATFFKQERLGEELTDGDVVEIKVRHAPFGVYMKWLEGPAGQELLFVNGVNNDKMLIKQVGWKARLVPVISLDPQSVLAMSRTRHPVTQLGLLNLTETLIANRRRDLAEKHEVKCQMFEDEMCDNRACYRLVLEYLDPEQSVTYRKSDLYIDKNLSIPVEITNFTWPVEDWGADWGCAEMDDATIIEYYSYCDLSLDANLSDLDFDRTNREYGFE